LKYKLKVEKNMKFWHYLLLALAAVLLIGSFFLPNAVAGITDARRLDNLSMIDSQSISINSTPDLALPERIALVASSKTKILPLKTGNTMEYDNAKEKIDEELARFLRDGPFQFDFDGYTAEEGTAALVVDTVVPTLNLVIWEFVLIDRSENKITVTVDDETGLILKLIYRMGNTNGSLTDSGKPGSSDDGFYSVAQSLTDMMKEYYGLRIKLADYQLSDNGTIAYYKADLSGGNRTIPMYGAIRARNFTMNERVKSVDG